MLLCPSTLAGGYKSVTLSRLHKYTQANRAYCFTVARIYLAVRARIISLYPSVRALTSTARVGIFTSLTNWPWWEGVESNHRSRFFRPARQSCTPPSHMCGFFTGFRNLYKELDAHFRCDNLTDCSLKRLLYASFGGGPGIRTQSQRF